MKTRTVTRTTTTRVTVTFTEAQVAAILREAAGADETASVEFDIGGGGWLRDDAVTVSWADETEETL